MKLVDKLSDSACLALGEFITAEGKRWRVALGQAWETGVYPAGSNVPELQKLRNSYGPTKVFGLKTTEVLGAAHAVALVQRKDRAAAIAAAGGAR